MQTHPALYADEMIMIIPHDYHIHSSYSPDGDSSLEDICHRALQVGLPELGFSEHWDVGPYEEQPRFFKPEPWYEEIERLRDMYAGHLSLRAGIEIAEPHLYQQPAADVLKRAPFDYVIGSVHWVGPDFMFDEQYFCQHSADEVYSSYFAELECMVNVADIDVVAHFDIPSRTAKPILGYDPARYEDQIRAILNIIIQRGLALDINAAGLRKISLNLMPDALILKWYAEMGGKHVTLGSDAHEASQVGLHLGTALQAVLEVGLTHVTQFDNRQARLLPIG